MDDHTKLIKILLIDDDRKLCRLIREYLHPVGFQVETAYSGTDGLARALNENFQAVILDIMMPGMDGLEVLRRLREHSSVPVLMFTAMGEETDRIVGLELGADDYIPKTFSSRELLARLKAVIRRSNILSPQPCLDKNAVEKNSRVIHDLIIDYDTRAIRQAGAELELTPVEFDLLSRLVENAGRILSRNQLLEAVTGRDYSVFDRSIDVHVSSLRRKLGDDPRHPRYIKTIRSAGYMFLDQDTDA